MEMNQNKIIEILKRIHYLEEGDIVNLGMVQDLKVAEEQISFSLLFQSANDPEIIPLKKKCINELRGEFEETKVNISVKISGKSIPKEEPKIFPNVKHIIAVSSGKGGVGKSTVSVNLAALFAREGYKVGLLDADIFGPSIPKMFGVEGVQLDVKNVDGKTLIQPCEKYGVKMLSIGFFVNSNQATIWRGPMAGNALKQLMQDGDWGELDYLFIDLPPGTSDIHLTMVQGVSVSGALIISTPQQVALADAIKGIDMFSNDGVNVPILGLIENMSWFSPKELPNNKYYIFGKGGCSELAEQYNIPFLGEIPLVQSICEKGDTGSPLAIEEGNVELEYFKRIMDKILKQL